MLSCCSMNVVDILPLNYERTFYIKLQTPWYKGHWIRMGLEMILLLENCCILVGSGWGICGDVLHIQTHRHWQFNNFFSLAVCNPLEHDAIKSLAPHNSWSSYPLGVFNVGQWDDNSNTLVGKQQIRKGIARPRSEARVPNSSLKTGLGLTFHLHKCHKILEEGFFTSLAPNSHCMYCNGHATMLPLNVATDDNMAHDCRKQ